MENQKNCIEVKNLCKRFNKESGFFARYGNFVEALSGISFNVPAGSCFGIVGESGSGKTTAARLLLRVYDADAGAVVYGGKNIFSMGKKELRNYRQKIKYIFQDPARSLNPRMSVKNILLLPYEHSLKFRKITQKKERSIEALVSILEQVGLSADDLQKYPPAFSGGQRQRISIARALLTEPEVLVCDEIVSALDVSIQAQILNLLLDIRKQRSLSLVFITHDLRIACYFCDTIAVMRNGKIVEQADAQTIYKQPEHSYTKELFESAVMCNNFSQQQN